MWIRRVLCGSLLPSFVWTAALCAQGVYRPVRDPKSPANIPYTRYLTRDRFGRTITFYIDGDQNQRLPIVVSVSGSGAFSNFIRSGDRILDAHRVPREVFASRAHILIVEKPGMEFLEQHASHGTAEEASPEFRREHTLDRWAEAVSAAMPSPIPRDMDLNPSARSNRTAIEGWAPRAIRIPTSRRRWATRVATVP